MVDHSARGWCATRLSRTTTRSWLFFPLLQDLVIQGASLSPVFIPEIEPGHAAGMMKDALVAHASLGLVSRKLQLDGGDADVRALREWVEAVPSTMRDWSVETLKSGLPHVQGS